ncbi:MAG: ATP-binding protein, partial [Pseudomonadota bacterium]
TLLAVSYIWYLYRDLPVFSHPMTLPNMLGTMLVVSFAAYNYVKQRQRKELELTRTLELAQQAEHDARIAREATTRFLGSMSHELRTPLTSIALSAEVLEEKLKHTDDAHWPANIQASTRSLLLLLNDILSLARSDVGQGARTRTPFRIASILESVRAITFPLATAKRVNLFIGAMPGTPSRWVGEEDRLRQVLINLLNNALQHAHARHVWLIVEPNGNDLCFSVGDDGCGIPEEVHREIFQPFVRGPAGEDNENGSGLGLAISGGYLRTMNSELTLESAPGAGALFGFTLKDGNIDGQTLVQQFPARRGWPKALGIDGESVQGLLWARAWLQAWGIAEANQADACFVVDAHGSQTGSVSEFVRQLSRMGEDEQIVDVLDPPEATALDSHMHCVICDDDARILDVLAARLKLAGHKTTCFASTEEMLRFTATHPVDVIILDLHFKTGSGLDALREIRERDAPHCFVPICMLSGALDERHACMKAGANAYLFKPASGAELLDTIHRITEEQKMLTA